MPRQPEEPTPDDVLDEMDPCVPFTAGELVERFDTSRWTIQRRLETLYDRGDIRRKEHAENRVSYWIEPDVSEPVTDGGTERRLLRAAKGLDWEPLDCDDCGLVATPQELKHHARECKGWEF